MDSFNLITATDDQLIGLYKGYMGDLMDDLHAMHGIPMMDLTEDHDELLKRGKSLRDNMIQSADIHRQNEIEEQQRYNAMDAYDRQQYDAAIARQHRWGEFS